MKEKIIELLNSETEEDIILALRILGDNYKEIFILFDELRTGERWVYYNRYRVDFHSEIIFDNHTVYINRNNLTLITGNGDINTPGRKTYDFRTDKGISK